MWLSLSCCSLLKGNQGPMPPLSAQQIMGGKHPFQICAGKKRFGVSLMSLREFPHQAQGLAWSLTHSVCTVLQGENKQCSKLFTPRPYALTMYLKKRTIKKYLRQSTYKKLMSTNNLKKGVWTITTTIILYVRNILIYEMFHKLLFITT